MFVGDSLVRKTGRALSYRPGNLLSSYKIEAITERVEKSWIYFSTPRG